MPESSWVQPIITLIERVGFPIAVTAWFLWRLNGKLDALVRGMADLTGALRTHIDQGEMRYHRDHTTAGDR